MNPPSVSDSLDSGYRILLICGSLRAGSVSGAVLQAARALVPAGATGTVYGRMGDLPHYSPDRDRDPVPEPVADLRSHLDQAHAVLFSTPEYAGSLPGSFKNLLDWTIGGGLYEKPVGCINASVADGRAQGAHQALRAVLAFTGSDVVEAAYVQVPVPRNCIDADGVIREPKIRAAIGQAVAALVERVAIRATG
jgi:NAD(P)H-dependent FMN reductase